MALPGIPESDQSLGRIVSCAIGDGATPLPDPGRPGLSLLAVADDDFSVGKLNGIQVDAVVCLGDLHDTAILRVIRHYQPRVAFAVRGNHDTAAPLPDGVIDLHCRTASFGGLRFGGFGGSWRYKPRGHHLYDQAEASELLRSLPAVDVMITHNSPAGIHERDDDTHRGFTALIDYIQRCSPSLLLHGHQHMNCSCSYQGTQITGVYGERQFFVPLPPSG